jgi:uncharacterized protein YutE (UPF0331/DUF86 family)
MRNEKLSESLADLKAALENYNKKARERLAKRLAYLSLSKAFEVAVQYGWKVLKRKVMEEGLDPQSPKGAIRDAAKINLIDNVELWLGFIDARNSAVHDYFSITEILSFLQISIE